MGRPRRSTWPPWTSCGAPPTTRPSCLPTRTARRPMQPGTCRWALRCSAVQCVCAGVLWVAWAVCCSVLHTCACAWDVAAAGPASPRSVCITANTDRTAAAPAAAAGRCARGGQGAATAGGDCRLPGDAPCNVSGGGRAAAPGERSAARCACITIKLKLCFCGRGTWWGWRVLATGSARCNVLTSSLPFPPPFPTLCPASPSLAAPASVPRCPLGPCPAACASTAPMHAPRHISVALWNPQPSERRAT